jgi:type II secretory pathway pseudopilin PulG
MKLKLNHHYRNQNGVISIELIIGMIVIAVLLALSTGQINRLFSGSNFTKEMSNVSTLYANTKMLKSTSGYGTGDLTSQLVEEKGIPQNMSVLDGVIYNSWGGTTQVVGTGIGFYIRVNRIPKDVYIKLSREISKSGQFSSVSVNGGSAVVSEITSVAANGACNSEAENYITFTSDY